MIVCYRENGESLPSQLKEALEGFDWIEAGVQALPCTMAQIAQGQISQPDAESQTELVQQPQDAPARPAGMLGKRVFCYFVDEEPEQVFALRDRLISQGVELPLMAMKTENNWNWKLQDLLQEVLEEDQVFARREELASLLQKTDRTRLGQDVPYTKAVYACMALLEEDTASLKLLDMATAMLKAANGIH